MLDGCRPCAEPLNEWSCPSTSRSRCPIEQRSAAPRLVWASTKVRDRAGFGGLPVIADVIAFPRLSSAQSFIVSRERNPPLRWQRPPEGVIWVRRSSRMALDLVEQARYPRTTVQTPFRWHDNGWRANFSARGRHFRRGASRDGCRPPRRPVQPQTDGQRRGPSTAPEHRPAQKAGRPQARGPYRQRCTAPNHAVHVPMAGNARSAAITPAPRPAPAIPRRSREPAAGERGDFRQSAASRPGIRQT